MDAALNRTSLKWGIPGIVLQIGAVLIPRALGYADPKNVPVGVTVLYYVVALSGTALLIVGLSYYAAAKGHSRWAGLLGLLSIIGLIVLAVLPDRHKRSAVTPA